VSPNSISPATRKARETHHPSRPWMKLKVPSIGSTTQTRSPKVALSEPAFCWEPYSSPRTSSPKRCPSRSMTSRSTARSASVAKSSALLVSTPNVEAGPERNAMASAPASRANTCAAAKRAASSLSARLFPIIVARGGQHPPPCPPPQGRRGFLVGVRDVPLPLDGGGSGWGCLGAPKHDGRVGNHQLPPFWRFLAAS